MTKSKWKIEVNFSGTMIYEIEANNKEEAIKKADEIFEEQSFSLYQEAEKWDWETVNHE